MKTMLKVTLMIAMFGSMALADDGQMGSGGRNCPPEGCPPPPCTENCGRAAQIVDEKDSSDPVKDIVTAMVRRYFSRF